jgi:hypothetical protein
MTDSTPCNPYIENGIFGDPSDAGKEARVIQGWELCQSERNFEIRELEMAVQSIVSACRLIGITRDTSQGVFNRASQNNAVDSYNIIIRYRDSQYAINICIQSEGYLHQEHY